MEGMPGDDAGTKSTGEALPQVADYGDSAKARRL